MTDAVTLGFIGLGRMGSNMSRRLVEAGERVVGFDLAGTSQRLPQGATEAASIADAARRAAVLFLSLPDGVASLAVCSEVSDVSGRRTDCVVDLSTIGMPAAQECASRLAERGISYVDAPVSGGVAGAASGGLAMMVGAPQPLYDSLEPLLSILARNRFRVGDAAGLGQAMKLVNNYISAAALAATAEATVFGERVGLDLRQMVEVLNVSSGQSAASRDKFPRSVVARTYDYGFAASLMVKDVSLYLNNAEKADTPHELATRVAEVWRRFSQAEPDADFTAIHRYLEQGGD